MKRRVHKSISVLLALVMCLIMIPVGVNTPVSAATGGYGSNGNFLAPIEASISGSIPISDRAGLEAIRNDLRGNYHLTRDIDLSDADWIPIGSNTGAGFFNGTFDGQGYEIRNMKITEAVHYDNYESVGLFGRVGWDGAKNTITIDTSKEYNS